MAMTNAEKQKAYRLRTQDRIEAARDLLGAIRRKSPKITEWPEYRTAEQLLLKESN